jgi:precorrin-2 dehydrogenase / sirohydrochlorin ferrochelatase
VLPIVLHPHASGIGLAGEGEGLERRLDVLRSAGVEPLRVAPGGPLNGLSILFVAGLEPSAAKVLAQRARRLGILVNVEDVPSLCDFNVPAILRRGDLMFTVSTHGRAPGLARRLREWLQERFGPEWEAHLVELGAARDRWRAQGLRAHDMAEQARHLIDGKGWLS